MSAKRLGGSSCVDRRRLNWVGPLAVLSSIASVICVRYIGIVVVRADPAFPPLKIGPVVIDTAVFVTFAVFVFFRVISGGDVPRILLRIAGWQFFTLEPIKAFRLLAFRALLVSILPDIGVAMFPRAKWSYGVVLAAMHVAAWAACVPILTSLTTAQGRRDSSREEDTESE